MRKRIMLFVLGFLPMMMAGQSVMLSRSLEQLPNSQADVQYNNLFGEFRNDALDEPFPYVVIEMNLSGGESAVRMAKERISLDVGTMLEVKSTVKTLPNKIVFLIQKGVRNIYILCGDGCEKILLYSGTLIGNKVYTCTVEYQPAAQQGGGSQDAVLAQMAAMQKQMEQMQKQNEQMQKLLEKQQSGGGGGVIGTPTVASVTVDEKLPGRLSDRELEFDANGVRFVMVKVSGGTFRMGSENGASDEKPVHSVTLSDYYIGQTEVTQALWEAVMGSTVRQQRDKANTSWPMRGEGDDYPMYYISWEECQEFVGRLSRITGRRFALPTEAQWEYAARGGNKSREYKYSGSDNIYDVAWYDGNSYDVAWYDGNSSGQTHPVGQKQANELGLYDMSGNVWEWCQDWKGSYPSSPQSDPKGPSTGSCRVNRGGSWFSNASFCRSALRDGITPGTRDYHLGLRLVLLF